MSDTANSVAIDALRSTATLVSFSTHKWQPMKTNNALAKEVKDSKHARGRAVSTRVNLANGFEGELSKVTRVMSRAYHAHIRMTVAWGTEGQRLLPNLQLIEYMTEMQEHRTALDKAKTELLPKLPQLIANAVSNNAALGDINDYPKAQDIVDSFEYEWVFSPLSDADGFAGLPEGFREKFEENYRTSVSNMLAGGIDDTKQKIAKLLSDWLETLEKDKPKFYQSTIEKLSQFGTTLNNINVNNDETLTEICKHIGIATQYTADQLRDNMNSRVATAATVRALLALLGDEDADDCATETPVENPVYAPLGGNIPEPPTEPESDDLGEIFASLPGIDSAPEPEPVQEDTEPEVSSDASEPDNEDDGDDINDLANSLLNL